MARRKTKPSTDAQIWLRDALKSYLDYYQADDLAWQELVRVLAAAPRAAWTAEFKGHPVSDLWKRLGGKGNRQQFAVAPHPEKNFITAHDERGPYTAFRIRVARAYVLERLPVSRPASGASAPSRPRPQFARALRALHKLFPPDGKVPAGMPVETARGQVVAELADESRRLGLGDPSWKVVSAAIKHLGRARPAILN
jgi:hypothetical protein